MISPWKKEPAGVWVETSGGKHDETRSLNQTESQALTDDTQRALLSKTPPSHWSRDTGGRRDGRGLAHAGALVQDRRWCTVHMRMGLE